MFYASYPSLLSLLPVLLYVFVAKFLFENDDCVTFSKKIVRIFIVIEFDELNLSFIKEISGYEIRLSFFIALVRHTGNA